MDVCVILNTNIHSRWCGMIIQEELTLEKKLEILGDAAKYDVACTSSGVDRKGTGSSIGNAVKAGICHSFAADGRCISLLKILMTNECIFQCKYCINRARNDVLRATFTPEEVARLTMEFYRRNYIEGLFLSSGIYPTPDATAERMLEAIALLRFKYRFAGYIHVKTIPGADERITEQIGWLADRMSVNLELPTAEGLRSLAPNKNRKNILTPMRQIQMGIHQNQLMEGRWSSQRRGVEQNNRILLSDGATEYGETGIQRSSVDTDWFSKGAGSDSILAEQTGYGLDKPMYEGVTSGFVPAGQSTQMIIGATGETDYQVMAVTESLYQKFELKRVFYSSFVNVNRDSDLPDWQGRELLDREHRLYQADFLLRFYQFQVGELLSPERPNFNMLLDPKCDYAVRHLELFPVEINRADYHTLLRVPGIGVKSAQRIVKARRLATLDFADLKKIGVVLKRAVYFITCRGRMMYPMRLSEDTITGCLVDENKRKAWTGEGIRYEQLSLFDMPQFPDSRKEVIS